MINNNRIEINENNMDLFNNIIDTFGRTMHKKVPETFYHK